MISINKIMKRLFLICTMTLPLLILATGSKAQNFSLTGGLGGSNYRGDLATNYTPPFGAAFSLGATYDVASRWRIRGNFTSLKIQGDDALSPAKGIPARGLNFKTNVSEFALLGEYDLLDNEYNRIIPYIFGGVAVYHFDPHPLHPIAGYGDVDLHSLGTEGQNISNLTATIKDPNTGLNETLTTKNYSDRKYNLTQLNVQLGAGVRYEISDDISLGFEVNLRKLFTDYLDDVSGPSYVTPTDWSIAEAYYKQKGDFANYNKTVEAAAYAYRGVLGSKFIDANAISYPRGNPNNGDSYYSFQLRLNVRINSIGGPDGILFSNEHTNGRKQLRCSGNVY